MNWLHYIVAAIAGALVLELAGAPPVAVIGGVVIAGGITYIRKLIAR